MELPGIYFIVSERASVLVKNIKGIKIIGVYL
jgi:hypothetical protein